MPSHNLQLPEPNEQIPLLTRIKIATIGASDLAKIERCYTKYFDYKVHLKDRVTPELAASWGAPKMANRRAIYLASRGSPDVYIRAVQIEPVNGYRPMTTIGWNAFEIIVDDIERVYGTIKGSPFKIIGEPKSLGNAFASIHAMQVEGPASEILYLTTETGGRNKSRLPEPKSPVDRPFIFVLAGHDVGRLTNFYCQKFRLKDGGRFDGPLTLAAQAQGFPLDTKFGLGLVRLAQRGNSIEVDGYPPNAPVRPRSEGELPPGNAMASFNVKRLDQIKVRFITPPAKLYEDRLAATFVGPYGELTELIEEDCC